MSSQELLLDAIAGWSAIINGIAFITSAAALVIFFSVGGFWGRINDFLSVIWALTFIPLAMFFYQLNGAGYPIVSLVALIIGIGAMLVFANVQTLLIANILKYQQTTGPVLASAAVIGIWVIINGIVGIVGETLTLALVLVGFIFALGLILGLLSYWFLGDRAFLSSAAFVIASIFGTIYSFWLGLLLLSGQMITA